MTQTCPQCGSTMKLDTASAIYRCPTCRHTVKKPHETLEQAQARLRAKGVRPAVVITHRGEVDSRALSVFETGHDYLWMENTVEAIRQFERALEIQPDFADPHLWLARLADDEAVKRHHLGEILAHDMGHTEALRMMMVLNGRLTPEQAAQTYHANAPEQKRVEQTAAVTEVLLCPVCGGHLTVDDDAGRVYCRFCGHEAPLKKSADIGADVLGMALLERKTQRVQWVIGERLLHCNQCGADRTLPARKLSMSCPFCGSAQVIVQDALGSFEQPHGLVPFALREEAAQAAVREKLSALTERLYSVRDGNKVARAAMEGLYLPFWVFDVLLDVSITTVDKRTSNQDLRWIQAGNTGYSHTTTMGGVNGLAICAVKSLATSLTDALGEYDLDTMLSYDPRLLAQYPAELYEIDFDEASLEARSRASEQVRNEQLAFQDSNVETTVSPSVIQMSFSLVLMPVWVVTLYERDGDVRTALVNGQSGQVAIGRAKKQSSAQ
jgi:DNA-directed RNA polymerase subunit M/transcription elongation factor TFIIS